MHSTIEGAPEGAQTQPAKHFDPVNFVIWLVASALVVWVGVTLWHRHHQPTAAGVDLSQYDTATVEHTWPDRHPGAQDGTYVHAVGSCELARTPGAVGSPVVDLEATQLPPGGTLPVTVTGNGPTRTDTLRADGNGWAYGMWPGPAGGTLTLTITQNGQTTALHITLPTQCNQLHQP